MSNGGSIGGSPGISSRRRFLIATACLAVIGVGCGASSPDGAARTAPRVRLTTTLGVITIELFPDKAPISVRNFLAYSEAGYYDGTAFHRVITNFMVQGGGLTAALEEKRDGQRPPIENEGGNGLRNEPGTVAMARTADPNSATSQFFINLAANRFLDRDRSPDKVGYAVFGQVVEGMDVVRRIEQLRTTSRGAYRDVPVEPVVITSARIVGQ